VLWPTLEIDIASFRLSIESPDVFMSSQIIIRPSFSAVARVVKTDRNFESLLQLPS
jgi:hypothetical protein